MSALSTIKIIRVDHFPSAFGTHFSVELQAGKKVLEVQVNPQRQIERVFVELPYNTPGWRAWKPAYRHPRRRPDWLDQAVRKALRRSRS